MENGRVWTFIATEAEEHSPRISPDGEWVAYFAEVLGRPEVFVSRFAPADQQPAPRRFRVSSDGGFEPRWSTDGRTLYFVSVSSHLMSTSVAESADGASLQLGELVEVEDLDALPGEVISSIWDVHDDRGVVFVHGVRDESASGRVQVVLGWDRELSEILGP